MTSSLADTNDEHESTSTTQALYGQSSKTSFLDLPPEIRAIIIRAILGDRKVHVHYPRNVARGVYVPRFSFCELERLRKVTIPGDTNTLSESYVNAHSPCYARPGYTTRHTPEPLGFVQSSLYHRQLDRRDLYFDFQLSMMAVSRQLREEAMVAFYSTNVFSIADSTSFKLFLGNIVPDRARLIKKLELSTTMDAMTWKRRLADSYGQSVQEWSIDRHQRHKLSNVSGITIRLCDLDPNRFAPEKQHILRSYRAKHMNAMLRTAFANLQKLKRLSRVDVHIRCEPRYINPAQADLRVPEMDKGVLQEIGRDFAAEILRRDGKSG